MPEYYLNSNQIMCEYLRHERAFRLILKLEPERQEDGTYKHDTFQFLIPEDIVRSMAETLDPPNRPPSRIH